MGNRSKVMNLVVSFDVLDEATGVVTPISLKMPAADIEVTLENDVEIDYGLSSRPVGVKDRGIGHLSLTATKPGFAPRPPKATP